MMATAIGCDLCQREPADMMQTVLKNGDTISVGAACMVTFFASSLTAMLSDAPPEMLNDLSAALVPLGAMIGPQMWDAESDQVKYAEGNHYYAEGVPRRTPEEDEQSEADSMAVEQPDAMVAEE